MTHRPDQGPRPEAEDYSSAMRQLGLWLTLPILLAVAPLVGLFAGQWVDRKFGCAPWGALILTFVGLAAGVVETQRLVKTAQRIQDTKK